MLQDYSQNGKGKRLGLTHAHSAHRRRKVRKNSTTNGLLLLIAIALIAIAIRPLLTPRSAQASSSSAYPFHIEPGVQMLRAPDGTSQVYGMVVVDMRSGKIWGFPTYTQSPYPIDVANTKPPISHPFELGTFAFADIDK